MKQLISVIISIFLFSCLTTQPSISNKKVYFNNDYTTTLPNETGFHHNIFPYGVNKSALSSNGKYIALFHNHNTLTIYDTESMKPLWTKISRGISNIQISPDDKLLSVTDTGNGLIIFDIQTGEIKYNLHEDSPFNSIFHYGYYNNGREILLLDNKTIYRFDLETKSLVKSVDLKIDRNIYNLTMNLSKGEFYNENKEDNLLSVYNIETGKHVKDIPLSVKPFKIHLSGNGQYVTVLSKTNELLVIDYDTSEIVYQKTIEGRRINEIKLSHDGSMFAYTQAGIKIWNWKEDREIYSERSNSKSIHFTTSDNRVYYTTNSNLNYFDFTQKVNLTDNKLIDHPIYDLELSGDGLLYASSPYGKVKPVYIFDTQNFNITSQLDQVSSSTKKIKLLPDSSFIGMGHKNLYRYSLNTKEILWDKEIEKPYSDFDISLENNSIICTDYMNKQLLVYDIDTGEVIRQTPVESRDSRLSVSISKIGTMAYGPVSDGKNIVEVVDIKSGQLINSFELVKNAKPIAKISKDGNTLITAGTRGIVTIWDIKSGKKIFSAETGNMFANCIDFFEETQKVVIGYNTLNITIIDIKNKTLKNLSGHKGRVKDVLFSENGKYIFSTSEDSSIRLWDTETEELILSYLRIDDENYVIFNDLNITLTPKAVKNVIYSDGNSIYEGQAVVDKYYKENFHLSILNSINLNN